MRMVLIVVFFAWVVSSSTLPFSKDGTFKILQVADLHYETGKMKCHDIDPKQYPNCEESNSTQFISRAIATEKPDLVVYTGDNIDYATPDAVVGLNEAFAPVEQAGVPWAAVLGNHDGQSTMTRQQVVQYMSDPKHFPHSLTENGPTTIHGWGNYFIDLVSATDSTPASHFRLYFLDSGCESLHKGVSGYDWIHPDQLEWFREQESSTAVSSAVFFHIPLREYKELIDEKIPIVGHQYDVFHIPVVNSGAYSTFLEKSLVKAVVVGHDHLNDYCGDMYGIQLCYGGVVGLDAYSKVGWPRRVRVIQLEEFGKSAKTWKRLDDEHMTTVDTEVLF